MAIKAQALANFIAEFTYVEEDDTPDQCLKPRPLSELEKGLGHRSPVQPSNQPLSNGYQTVML